MNRLLVASLFVAALVACSSNRSSPAARPAPAAATAPEPPPAEPAAPATDGSRPASVSDDMVAVAERMTIALEAMGRDLDAAGTDCAMAATALRTHAVALRPVAADAAKLEDQNDEAAAQWFEKTYGQRVMSALGSMMRLAGTCAEDTDFQKASEEFGEAMDV